MCRIEKITIAGVPNCGKTAIFNSLTGSHQKVGNWPGVTVEKIEGSFPFTGTRVELIDLPGTYNLRPESLDQKIAERVISRGEYDLILNVVDATNLSRNLFLTMDLKERTSQIVVLLNMMDVAEKEGIHINIQRLSEELGLKVVPVVGIDKKSVRKAITEIERIVEDLPVHDSHLSKQEVMDAVKKYAHIDHINCRVSMELKDRRKNLTNRVDRIVLNRFAAFPIFLITMFITFWFAIGLGSVFIDFFDIIGGLIFVDIPGALLDFAGSPGWLTLVIAGGLGVGCQTVATFIPIVFTLFFALAILEDFGYMARVGVIADRFMRKIGLPGSAFIPMVVGFGCTVPAVMAARPLTTKRDRFMTIFMAPFMSCGARLPVYALFCAALFGSYSSLAAFLLYLSGLCMAILTGYILKNTLFRGTPATFIIDLPLYHTPRPGAVFKSAWLRLQAFIKRAGTIVVAAVLVLSVLNSIGVKNGEISFDNEDSHSSALAYAGKAIAPIFYPMGLSQDNWPASVALFTGLFAKEAIVGTVNAFYVTQGMSPKTTDEKLDIGGAITEAFTTIREGIVAIISSLDLLDLGIISEDPFTLSKEVGVDTSLYQHIAANFTVVSAFAYLLFVLMYFPCLAVIAAARKEMGGFYAAVMAGYSTLLAWSVATFFYQLVEGHNLFYIILSVAILIIVYGWLLILGKTEGSAASEIAPPPVIKDCV